MLFGEAEPPAASIGIVGGLLTAIGVLIGAIATAYVSVMRTRSKISLSERSQTHDIQESVLEDMRMMLDHVSTTYKDQIAQLQEQCRMNHTKLMALREECEGERAENRREHVKCQRDRETWYKEKEVLRRQIHILTVAAGGFDFKPSSVDTMVPQKTPIPLPLPPVDEQPEEVQ